MAAQDFTTKYYRQPAVFAANFPGIIERSVNLDLDLLIGPDGTDANPLEAGDKIKLFKLPQGCKLCYGGLAAETLAAANLTLDLFVTDGTTTKYFLNEAIIGVLGGQVDTRSPTTAALASAVGVITPFGTDAAVGFVTTNGDFYVGIGCGTAAASTADGLRAVVGYTMCTELDEANRDWPDPIPT
jgi:hypothetical protein